MGKFFLKKILPPLVYVQNDHRVMGIIFRYVRWGAHRPPPPRGPRRLIGRPTYPPPRRMPAVVRMPACHSRRFKSERPIGAATG